MAHSQLMLKLKHDDCSLANVDAEVEKAGKKKREKERKEGAQTPPKQEIDAEGI